MGLSPRFAAESDKYIGLFAGRIISQSRDLYRVATEQGEVQAEVSGKFRFDAGNLSVFPAVGDFVMIDRKDNTDGNAVIHHVLPRKSAFIRRSAAHLTRGKSLHRISTRCSSACPSTGISTFVEWSDTWG